MRKFFRISGYWKDDESEFSDYLATDFDDCPEDMDDDLIFFYGLGENSIKSSSDDDGLEFVITSYEDVTEQF